MAGFTELAEILVKQGTQIADIGKKLTQEKYIVIPARKYPVFTNFDDATNKAKEFDESVYIVRVVQRKERYRKYGIVNHTKSVLNGKKVVIGRKNANDLVRCSACDEFNNPCRPIDFIHESFITLIK